MPTAKGLLLVKCCAIVGASEELATCHVPSSVSFKQASLSLLQSSHRISRSQGQEQNLITAFDLPDAAKWYHERVAQSHNRVKSNISGCAPVSGTNTKEDIKHKVKPCGFYSSLCIDLFTVHRNITYPGNGAFDPKCGTDYIVQFDVGLRKNVEGINASKSIYDTLDLHPNADGSGEVCLEVIITDCDDWGNLGITTLPAGGYDNMGGCGAGKIGVGDAMDCLKHDVCSAFKSAMIEGPATGFCDDPDCGDEAAQTLFNCQNHAGEATICDCHGSTQGSWSAVSKVFGGNCKAYQGCDKGQGIPS